MIREVDVSNYQSLRKLRVVLGRGLTVITGPTGSGKSAFIRAVLLLVNNARGTGYISHGEKTCSVSLTGDEIELTGMDDDPWQAVIQRGSRDAYRLSAGINQKTYTKMAGKVPEPVTEVIRLGDINFATQFDKPYLLDSTGGEVARVLGKLTNVTVLYRAAQEANRRRLQSAGELRTRRADLDALSAQAAQYSTLPAELGAVESMESHMLAITQLQAQRERLAWLLATHVSQEAVLADLVVPPVPPTLVRLGEMTEARKRLAALSAFLAQSMTAYAAARHAEEAAAAAAESSRQELDKYTSQWGICPTCGQPVRKDHAHDDAH